MTHSRHDRHHHPQMITPQIKSHMLFILASVVWSTAVSAQSDTVSIQQRQQAASQAASNSAECRSIQPFYFEIGDVTGKQVSGSVGSGAGGRTVTADSVLKIASASKWIFGSYVVQRKLGNLTDNEVQALTMRAGYTNFGYGSCAALPAATTTVLQCAQVRNIVRGGFNNDFNASQVGKFYYAGGHFQQLAIEDLQLGAETASSLGAAVTTVLNSNVTADGRFSITYDSAQLAAGVAATPGAYAKFLQAIVQKRLLISQTLSTPQVCTSPLVCPGDAIYTPIPASQSWFYSLGHWIEPKVAGAKDLSGGIAYYSSAGAFGFYPWVDAGLMTYGLIGREEQATNPQLGDTVAFDSVQCGAVIRNAWFSGNSGTTPTGTGTSPTSTSDASLSGQSAGLSLLYLILLVICVNRL